MRSAPLLLAVFLLSMATASAEHAVFFFTKEALGFGVMANLLLALVFGATYLLGARLSHPWVEWLVRRLPGVGSERFVLVLILASQVVIGGLLAWSPTPAMFWSLWPVLGLVSGVQWPIFESYVVAGRPPRAAATAISRFNVTWATAVVIAVAISGLLIAWWEPALFALGGLLNLAGIVILLTTFPERAAHLEDNHPDRIPAEVVRSYRPLIASSRWSMLSSYTLMFVLGPYLPEVFDALGYGVVTATLLAGVLYALRVVSFAWMGMWPGWHGKKLPLALGAVALPVGALLILLPSTVAPVLIGEVIFGFTAGVIYTASLYYGMIEKNASVEAGGDHEAVIGVGFCLGPLLGMAGHKLSTTLGSAVAGMTLGLSPMIVGGLVGGLWPLRKNVNHEVTKGTKEGEF
ncbi:MFS transporter [Phycisphaeraceae bacterium D3-23]